MKDRHTYSIPIHFTLKRVFRRKRSVNDTVFFSCRLPGLCIFFCVLFGTQLFLSHMVEIIFLCLEAIQAKLLALNDIFIVISTFLDPHRPKLQRIKELDKANVSTQKSKGDFCLRRREKVFKFFLFRGFSMSTRFSPRLNLTT